jgi:hypothetical protein
MTFRPAECRHRRVPQSAGKSANRGDLGNHRCESQTVTGPAPTDGVCAYALAFSTLLSSQGADAHRHKAFAWIGGNPLSLPASSRAVKRFHSMLTGPQPLMLPAYLAADRPDAQTVHSREFLWLAPRTGRPEASRSCLGQDETLGIQAIHVKSRGHGPPLAARRSGRLRHSGPGPAQPQGERHPCDLRFHPSTRHGAVAGPERMLPWM